MQYLCINPKCKHPENPEGETACRNCSTPLLINDRFILTKRLSAQNRRVKTDIFLVQDRVEPDQPKILKSSYDNDPMRIELYEREFTALTSIGGKNKPKCNPIDGKFTLELEETTVRCLVMSYVEGQTLKAWVENNRLDSEEQIIDWIEQICKILKRVHDRGFFHRDIKPENIIIDSDGKLSLIDFGAVRDISDTYYLRLSNGADVTGRANREITGVFSSGYSPAEQINGKAMPQSDFYALGRTIMHLITGTHPGRLPCDYDTGEIEWRQLAPHISEPLLDYLDFMMAVGPGKRPINCLEVLEQLEELPKKIEAFRERPSQEIAETQEDEVPPEVKTQDLKPKLGLKKLSIAALIIALLGGWVGWSTKQAGAKVDEAQKYYNQGLEQAFNNNYAQARLDFEKSLHFNPDNPKAYQNLAVVCEALNDQDCMLKAYEKSIELDPQNWLAYYNRGDYYESIQDTESATQDYRKAIQISPEADRAATNLARLLIIQQDYQEATRLSEEMLGKAKDPSTRSSIYKNLGWIAYEQKDWATAERNLIKSIELDKEFVPAHCLLAKTLDIQDKQSLENWKACFRSPAEQPEVEVWKSERLKTTTDSKTSRENKL